MSLIWRRMRSLLKAVPSSESSAKRPRQGSYVPDLQYVPKEREASRTGAAGRPESDPKTAETEPPAKSVQEIAQSISTRLVHDQTIRGGLSEQELEPLLGWGRRRIRELSQSCSSLPAPEGTAKLQIAGRQLVDLIRLAGLAIGERTSASPILVVSRFQMMDTLLAPPLLEEPAVVRAQARLEVLLTEPPERIQSTNARDLSRRLAEVLR